jgi:hypothetical protein
VFSVLQMVAGQAAPCGQILDRAAIASHQAQDLSGLECPDPAAQFDD